MSRYNEFCTEVECPKCTKVQRAEFQAWIGSLDYDRFAIGDLVLGLQPKHKHPQFGPDPTVGEQDVWAYGLDTCDACGSDLWARIEIRDSRFHSAVLVDAVPDPYSWGLLV